MAARTPSEGTLGPKTREDLERVVVRLLGITARCGDCVIQQELKQLADDLARIIDSEQTAPAGQ